MKITNNIDRARWEDFLRDRPGATLAHTPQWKDFLEKTFDYKGEHLFVLDDNDIVLSMLPLFKVRNLSGGFRLCASPFYGECSFLGDGRHFPAVLERAKDLIKDSSYLEIRSPIDGGFEIKNLYSTYILELSRDAATVWEKLHKGSVRRAIKKSMDKGVQVVETNNREDLDAFYHLNCINKKEKGVPCHPRKFFRNIFQFMGDHSRLYLSMYKKEPVAGGIISFYNGLANYSYGASDLNHLDLYPNNAFLWKSIEDACSMGSHYYDFGRVSYDNTGLISFKKRWGTEEKKLFYSFYPHSSGSFTEDRASLKYRIITNVIKRSPAIVYENFSDRVFGYFG